MKLVAIILLAGGLQVSAAGYSQNVTLKVSKAPLVKVFKAIKQQTGFSFFYENTLLAQANPVTIDAQNMPLIQLLDICFANQPLTYSIVKRQITVKERKQVNLPILPLKPVANIDIKGRVVDNQGQPVQGATVRIQGSAQTVITNEKGEFFFSDVAEETVIIISSIGYETATFAVQGARTLTATLAIKTNSLDEAVVKGYYTTTKRLNTGNVSTVRAVDIERQPVSNPISALQGRVPGLIIAQSTGLPGGGLSIQLRGRNSIDNGNDPFYVIDGVPFVSQLAGSALNGSLRGGNPLNFINPADIESIEVLKDADATAIYGSRAANGVILITTKKGKAGVPKVNINAYTGIGQVARHLKLLNTEQYLEMRREAFKNDGRTPATSDYDVNGTWDTTRYTDWQKELLGGTAHFNDVQASVSGGSSNVQYLLGAGYHKETTVFPTLIKGSGADQEFAIRSNVSANSPDKKFKVQLSVNYLVDKNTVPVSDITNQGFFLAPNAPALFNEDGTLNWAPPTPGARGSWSHPLASFLINYNGNTTNLISNAEVSYSPFGGLELKTSFGYTNLQSNEKTLRPTTVFDPGTNPTSGSSNFSTRNYRTWIIEPQAVYKFNVGLAQFTALVGTTFNKNDNDAQRIEATGFSSDALLDNMQAATSLRVTQLSNSVYKYNAVFGRMNFSWKDKYLLNLTGRRDGSSRFGPENKFANFGAVGAAWIFSEESWLRKHLPVLSFGKLRFSYGTSGNDQIGDYRYLDVYSNTSYPYLGSQGLYPANLFNPLLSWELNKKMEGGIELGFWNERIFVNASYYRNRSGNQLVSTPLSYVTGFNSIPSNLPAVIENSGFELALNASMLKTKSFAWTSSVNLTFPRNKLVSFPDLETSSYRSSYIVGQPITMLKIYHLLGVNDTTGAYQYAGEKGVPTAIPKSGDAQTVINLLPKYYGGWQNNIQFKGLSIDFLFQFVKQTGSTFKGSHTTMPGRMGNQLTNVLDRWQKQGDQTSIQAFSQASASLQSTVWNYISVSDYIYGDASFIRLKNVSISWEMPPSWIKKFHLHNLRIYAQGQNLLTITNYNGLDPEVQSNAMPPLRVMTAGIQFTF